MTSEQQARPTAAQLETRLFVGGEFVDASDGGRFATEDPATGAKIADVAEATAADVDRAVKAARAAFPGWARTDSSERGHLLIKLAALLRANHAEFCAIESLDSGKPLAGSDYDMDFAEKTLEYYGGWADKLHGTTIPTADYFTYTTRDPIGVCGLIVPWNYPLLLMVWKLGPALACGNCVVVKPAEQTPLSALKFAHLVREAGFPPGVFNVVPGFGAKTGQALVEHPGVDKISFTGSTAIGKHIMRTCADTLKRVTLELGGKSPNIVFADANIDDAVPHCFDALFANAGQVCCAGSRLFVQAPIYDEFVARLKKFALERRVADPFADGSEQGPLVSELQMKRVLGFIESGRREGARLVAGGDRLGQAGYFVQPTVFADVKDSMEIAREEIFGPVLSVLKFDTEEEVIERANMILYGLASGVWTNDISRAMRVANGLRAGSVWINCYNVTDPRVPFGGFKHSGFGRELGADALDHYTETKAVRVRL